MGQHLMGLEIPSDMDGRVLKEIFSQGVDPARRKIEFGSVQSHESQAVRRKVEQLKRQGEI